MRELAKENIEVTINEAKGSLEEVPVLMSRTNDEIKITVVDDDKRLSLDELKNQTAHFDVGSQLTLGEFKATGGYSNIHEGEIEREDSTLRVAVKCFRGAGAEKDIEKAILRELFIWSKTQHENILPLIGFATTKEYKQPVLISQWMKNGTVTDYMKTRPPDDLRNMVMGIVNGLVYLHGEGVIHADLKPGNILISDEGKPLIADFGISRLHNGPDSITVCRTSTLHGSERYFAIELLLPEEVIEQIQENRTQGSRIEFVRQRALHTKKNDVWSFAMVVYQLLAKANPYYDILSNVTLYISLFQDRELRPRKPEELQEGDMSLLWSVCEACWHTDPKKRPSMGEVRKMLHDSYL